MTTDDVAMVRYWYHSGRNLNRSPGGSPTFVNELSEATDPLDQVPRG